MVIFALAPYYYATTNYSLGFYGDLSTQLLKMIVCSLSFQVISQDLLSDLSFDSTGPFFASLEKLPRMGAC